MLRRGSTVRVRQRASLDLQGLNVFSRSTLCLSCERGANEIVTRQAATTRSRCQDDPARCITSWPTVPIIAAPSGMYLGAVAEVEPDRLHDPEGCALGEDVRGREHARVLLDRGRSCDRR